MVGVISYFDDNNTYHKFIKIRREFEEFLLKHKMFPKQLVLKFGSGTKGFGRLRDLWIKVIDLMIANKSEHEILQDISSDESYSFLQPEDRTAENRPRSDFNTDTKSAVFLREAMQNPIRCKICGGLIHQNSISIDHITRKADGGLGIPDNGQLTHPYCNTTIKG
tara:strand:+ start:278 stop:772 length:495 start_codon:yes stop_codon:yes gene_type:complete